MTGVLLRQTPEAIQQHGTRQHGSADFGGPPEPPTVGEDTGNALNWMGLSVHANS